MSKTISLFRTMLQSGFDSRKKQNMKTKDSKIIRKLMSIIISGAILYLIYLLAERMFDKISAQNTDMFIYMIVAVVASAVFVMCFMIIAQEMYFAKDVKIYRYLPIKKRQILLFRFIKSLFFGFVYGGFITVPFITAYFVKTSAPFVNIFSSVIVILFFPVIPVAMIGVITILLMRFFKFLKSEKALTFIGLISGAIGINIILQPILQGSAAMEAMTKLDGFLTVLLKFFPGMTFAVNALVMPGIDSIINLMLFILSCAGTVFVFLIIGNLFYYKGLEGIGEEKSRRKAIDVDKLIKKTLKNSQFTAYVKKEIKILFRTTILFIQCFVTPLLMSGGILIGFLFKSDKNDVISELVEYIDAGILVAFICCICVIISSLNTMFGSSVSREGSGYFFMKYLPIPVHKQLFAKITVGISITLLQLILLGTAFILMGLPANYVLLSIALSLFIIISIAMLGTMFDVQKPKLVWSDIQSALFLNINVILTFFMSLAFAVISFLPIVISNWGLSIWEYEFSLLWFSLYIILFFGALNFVLYKWIKNNSRKYVTRR